MDEDEIDDLMDQIDEIDDEAVGLEIILRIIDGVGTSERAG